MATKKTGTDTDNSNNNFKQTQPIPIEDSLSNNKKSNTPKNPPKKKDNVIVNIIQPKSSQPKVANIIAGIAALISFGLGIITYSLFLKSSAQTQAALRADTIAYKSYKSSDSINKVNAALNKQTFDETKTYNNLNSIDAAKKNKRDSLSFAAQIASLKETQKEFDIENRPLVQVLNIRFDTLVVGKRLVIKYDFINYGKQPVKCLVNKMQAAFSEKNKTPIMPKSNWAYTILNSFMSGSSISTNSWTSIDTVTKVDYDDIKKGTYKAYIMGELSFENTVTFKKSIYIYEYSAYYNNNAYGNEGIKDTTIQIVKARH